MFIVLFWAKNIVSKTVQIPLSPMYIWVHIIENENQFYRKRDYSKLVAKLSTTINKIQNLSNSSNCKIKMILISAFMKSDINVNVILKNQKLIK
jgi:hypothetical protein